MKTEHSLILQVGWISTHIRYLKAKLSKSKINSKGGGNVILC